MEAKTAPFSLRVAGIMVGVNALFLSFKNCHVFGIIPFSTVAATEIAGMATGIKRSFPTMEQEMVCLVFADDKVIVSVVISLPVHMVNLSTIWKILAKRFFRHDNMLSNTTSRVGPWVIMDKKIYVSVSCRTFTRIHLGP